MPYAPLPHRGLIRLFGDDTLTFLQGLVTNDVMRLMPGDALYSALLTPQGKFLHDFFIIRGEDDVLMDVDSTRLNDLVQRLNMYKLRSKVTIETLGSAMTVAALWESSDIAPPPLRAFADPRVNELGWRIVGESSAIVAWCNSVSVPAVAPEAYEQRRIALGVPEGVRDLIPDKSFLLQYGFEDLHGVDFRKGCYVGQEVTARSKHLGQVRKFIYKVQSPDMALPAAGTPIHLDGALSGEMRSSYGKAGLALLSVEDVEKARQTHTDFRAGDTPLSASLPAWVKNTPAPA